MNLNDAMRKYAKATLGLAADATDEQIKSALGAALMEQRIDQATWASLRENKEVSGRQLVQQIIGEWGKGFEDRIITLIKEQKGATVPATTTVPAGTATTAAGGASGGNAGTVPGASTATLPAPGAMPTNPGELEAFVQHRMKGILEQVGVQLPANGQRVSPTQMLSRAASSGYLADPQSIRVKSPLERYSTVKVEARWPDNHKHKMLQGMRVTAPGEEGPGLGRPLDIPSQSDKAVVGVYFKWMAHQTWFGGDMPTKYRMTDHDWEVVKYMVHELPWTGYVGGTPGEGATEVSGQKLADVFHRGDTCVKAILDDSISGGIQAVPLVIDDALIIQPLLYGELFPLVTVVNIARGRRIHQATMSRPTFTSGIPEGTPIPLFDTTNFLGTLDASVFTAVGSMEIGLDFEEDTPSNVGAAVIMAYGEAALAWLDRVIPLGDGVSEPLGIFNTPGLTAVASANGSVGPLTMADAESLMFGVNKAYRTTRGGRNVLIGNETSYRRFRSIPLGSQWENSRAFGTDYANFTVLNAPYKVVPLIPNNWVAYANLGYYRMWRRLGMTTKIETAGKNLTLANTKLIVCRMRYAGLPEQAGAFSVMTDAPA
jgi:HK97 family phage major capsid protein